MSNRKALRELSNFLPAPQEVERIMDGLMRESDRSAAILAHSLLDMRLQQLIESRLIHKNQQIINNLFGGNGPLSTFSYKTSIAVAFGIITTPIGKELDSIRAIRNAFAHSVIELTFEHEAIVREVHSLRMLNAMSKSRPLLTTIDVRQSFLLAVRILLIVFDGIEKHRGLADAALADALARE